HLRTACSPVHSVRTDSRRVTCRRTVELPKPGSRIAMCWRNLHAFDSAPPPPPPTPLILVVEDHDSARTALTKLLSSTGYDVIEAHNGSDALAKLANGPRPDLILLDLMMPVMDGWEFLQRQRRDWHLCTIPTIVVSGVASHDPRCLKMP